MNTSPAAENTKRECPIAWAVETEAPLAVSLLPENRFNNMRSQFVRHDAAQGLIQVLYPICGDGQVPPEMAPGTELGLAFRRGHKKCIFVSQVVTRQKSATRDGAAVDTLVIRAPGQVREMQRRLYQRVTVPAERMVACKLWQGGAPKENVASWPLCAGRVGNISLGGLLLDIRAEHNPRLTVGEIVGVEITVRPGQPALIAEGQYRHCSLMGSDRLGVGIQFIGMEKEISGRATLTQIAEFIRELRRSGSAPAPGGDE